MPSDRIFFIGWFWLVVKTGGNGYLKSFFYPAIVAPAVSFPEGAESFREKTRRFPEAMKDSYDEDESCRDDFAGQ